MEINTHRTAIKRKGPSRPLRDLLEYEPTVLDGTVLDVGCGYGEDVYHLRKQGALAAGYDPHKDFGFGTEPYTCKYNVVLLIYVLNVLPTRRERLEALEKAWSYAKPGGFLFVATRSPKEIRDLRRKHGWEPFHDGYITKKKTFQRGLNVDMIRSLALNLKGYVEMVTIDSTNYKNLLIAKGRWHG